MSNSSPSLLVRPWLLVVLLAGLAAAPRAQVFDPARHLPAGPLALLDCAGVDAWADGLGDSWAGQLASHPRMGLALAGLTDSIQRLAMQFGAGAWLATGLEPGRLREQLGGRLVVVLYDVDPRSGAPTLAVVLEGRGHGPVLAAGLQNVLKQRGAEWQPVPGVPGAQQTGGPGGVTLSVAELGDALVLTVGDVFHEIADLHASDDGVGALGSSPFGARLAADLGLARPGLLLALDGEAIVSRVEQAAARDGDDEVPELLAFSGLGRVGLTGLSLGFTPEGALEERSVLRLQREPPAGGDLIGTLFESLATPVSADVLDEALALLPADARSVGAARFDLAGLLGDLEALVRREFPESHEPLDEAWAELAEATGITRDTVLALPPLTMISAGVDPLAGGWLPDSLTLVRDAEIDPWWQLLERGLARIEVGFRSLDLGDGVIVRSVDWVGANGGPTLLERWVGSELGGMREQAPDARMLGLLAAPLSLPISNLARARVAEGWSAVAMLPQSLERHLRQRGSARLPGTPLGDMARSVLPGHVSAAVLQGDSLAPAAWNSLLALSGSVSPILGLAGIDGALLPPAELVPRGAATPGWMTLDVTPTRLAVSGSGSAVTPLLLGAGLGAGAALFLAAGRAESIAAPIMERADDAAHQARMRALYEQLVTHALAHDGAFPEPKGPVGAFQTLIDEAPPGSFSPMDFISPIGWESETWSDEDDRPRLDFYSCSWRMAPWPVQLGETGLLFFDAKAYLDGQRHVVLADGTILVLSEDQFQLMLREERMQR